MNLPRHSIRLFLLGSPRLLLDDQQVEPDTRKAVALLAYLAINGQAYTRDSLAALLYPEYDDSHARGALRRTLHALSKSLQGEHIRATRERIELNLDDSIWIDAIQFKNLLREVEVHNHQEQVSCPRCINNLVNAAALYRGDFLAGFNLRDSYVFDDWQLLQREELRRGLASALGKLARIFRRRAEFEKAIAYAHRWVDLDPLVEEAHRELMRCYGADGQRSLAIRQYQVCLHILEKELGVPPLEETMQLYQAILGQPHEESLIKQIEKRELRSGVSILESDQDMAAALSTPVPAGLRYPLVGRSVESEIIAQAYFHHATNGYLISLEGEPGIGKTRLAEEFLASIEAQGAPILKARCYEGESSLALGPLVDALMGVVADRGIQSVFDRFNEEVLSEMVRLIPTLRDFFPDIPSSPALSNLATQTLFYESLRKVLLQLLRDHVPGVLFIDDLQWADRTTLDFLAYFSRRLKGQDFLLLIAWRNDELQGSLSLQKILAEVQRAGIGSSLPLKRLKYKDVLDLVRVTTPQIGDAQSNFQEKLFQETEGLPYFLIEYLNTIHQESLETGVWGKEPFGWQMPQSVRDLLRMRTQNLDELSRQLLTTAAAIGRSFDFDTLLSASGRSEIETIAGLENLISHGLIEECSSCDTLHPVHYDFTHEKLRSLVYDETSQMRRRLLHRRVAEALMNARRQYPNPELLESKIAMHLHLAGEEVEAGEHYILAGDYARSLFANREALIHYQSALESGYPVSADLLLTIADMQTLLGEYRAALTSCQQASAFAEDADQSRIHHKVGRILLRAGQPQEAIEQFKAVVDNPNVSAPILWSARIFADWSLAAYQLGDVEQAQQLAQVSLRHALAHEDHGAATQAHNLLGILARFNGDFKLAHDELMKSIQLAEDSGDLDARAAALNNLALVLAEEGEFLQAIQITHQALEISERLGDRHRAAALRNNLADLYHQTGQSEKSMEELRKAVVEFAEIGEQATELRPEIWKLTEW